MALKRALYFALFVVGITVMLLGAGAWFATADKDYTWEYERVESEFPQHAGEMGFYDSLPEAHKEDFQRALDGEVIRYESRADSPKREVIKKDGEFYVFTLQSNFDWLNPLTFGPALLSLGGLAVVVAMARRDTHFKATSHRLN
ncbi:hypothetical protein [Halomarina litorea]|uniref:hypothetical protein n=1 Tax=Halomarina litorea TaxID=2961595 RepID=UPI0020C29402|nr:hypothetical protein [Halomarina sp. BCD28]